MRGGASTVEQTGGGEHEGAGADTGDTSGPSGGGRYVPQEPCVARRRARAIASRHDQGVEGSARIEAFGRERRVTTAAHQAWLRRQDLQPIGPGSVALGDLEGGHGTCDVEDLNAREDQETEFAGHVLKRGNRVISAAS